MRRAVIFRFRIYRSACSARPQDCRRESAWRSASRSSTLRRRLRRSTASPQRRRGPARRRASIISCRSGRRPIRRLRLALSRGLSAEHANDKSFRQHLTPMAQAEISLPAARRRLHRFLRLDLPRHQCRADVSAGQSTDAELQIRAGRLSQPHLVDSAERNAVQAAAWPAQGLKRGRRRAMGLRAISISSLSSACISARPANSANPSRSARRRSIFSAFACSTTGRRATCRLGSISRSVRF